MAIQTTTATAHGSTTVSGFIFAPLYTTGTINGATSSNFVGRSLGAFVASSFGSSVLSGFTSNALTNGLNYTIYPATIYAINLNVEIAVSDPPYNQPQPWSGLTKFSNQNFVDYYPLGFKRAFAFTQNIHVNGTGTYSKAGAILTDRDTTIINMLAKTGVPLFNQELANQHNYVTVSSSPWYTPPGPINTNEILVDGNSDAITDSSDQFIITGS